MKIRSTLLATVLCVSTMAPSALAVVVPFSQKEFTDVSKTHPNAEAIEYLRKENVLKGYPDGTFHPERRITRAEFVALVTNPFFLSGRSNDCLQTNFPADKTEKVFFRDVPRSAWFAQDICEANVHELINGYPDGTFKPNGYITFVEAAKIAANVFSISVRRDNEGSDAKWYVAYVRRLAELKAIPVSIKKIDQLLNRGEMAEIVFRLQTNNTSKTSATFPTVK